MAGAGDVSELVGLALGLQATGAELEAVGEEVAAATAFAAEAGEAVALLTVGEQLEVRAVSAGERRARDPAREEGAKARTEASALLTWAAIAQVALRSSLLDLLEEFGPGEAGHRAAFVLRGVGGAGVLAATVDLRVATEAGAK